MWWRLGFNPSRDDRHAVELDVIMQRKIEMESIQTEFVLGLDHPSLKDHVSACCDSGETDIIWDPSLTNSENHARAAYVLCRHLGYGGTWIGGWLPDGSMSWVLKNDESPSFSAD